MVLAALSSHFLVPSCSYRRLSTVYWAIGARLLQRPRILDGGCSRASSVMVVNSVAMRSLNTTTMYSTASGGGGGPGDTRFERPKIYQLEHIQKRLEFTTPLMFRTRLDYTFYRKDVILEDRILNAERVGIESLQLYFGGLGVLGQILFPHIETQLLNVSPILEDGTVRLRWRIVYLSWLKALDFRNFKLENRLKKVKWYDGYSIFYVDGDGLVYKMTLQKIMPDDSERRNTKKLAEKIGVLPGTTNFVGSDICRSDEKNFRKK